MKREESQGRLLLSQYKGTRAGLSKKVLALGLVWTNDAIRIGCNLLVGQVFAVMVDFLPSVVVARPLRYVLYHQHRR